MPIIIAHRGWDRRIAEFEVSQGHMVKTGLKKKKEEEKDQNLFFYTVLHCYDCAKSEIILNFSKVSSWINLLSAECVDLFILMHAFILLSCRTIPVTLCLHLWDRISVYLDGLTWSVHQESDIAFSIFFARRNGHLSGFVVLYLSLQWDTGTAAWQVRKKLIWSSCLFLQNL